MAKMSAKKINDNPLLQELHKRIVLEPRGYVFKAKSLYGAEISIYIDLNGELICNARSSMLEEPRTQTWILT
jgi:hypothetical protein